MIRYELVVGKTVLKSDDLQELQKFALDVKEYWVIYKVYCSCMNNVPTSVGLQDQFNILKLSQKNWTARGIATRFHMTTYQVEKILDESHRK